MLSLVTEQLPIGNCFGHGRKHPKAGHKTADEPALLSWEIEDRAPISDGDYLPQCFSRKRNTSSAHTELPKYAKLWPSLEVFPNGG